MTVKLCSRYAKHKAIKITYILEMCIHTYLMDTYTFEMSHLYFIHMYNYGAPEQKN